MRKNYSTDGFSNLTWGTFLRETISDRISHFLVKSIQKQLDKLNKNKSEDVQLENKNEPEFQYPTNLPLTLLLFIFIGIVRYQKMLILQEGRGQVIEH